MANFESINEVLSFAIKGEEEAVDFYTGLAAKTKNPAMKKAFEEFAGEERGHKERLEEMKKGGSYTCPAQKVLDLKISDYSVDVEPSADMSYQDVLILAMKKEKAAFKLYNELAGMTDDEDVRSAFLCLAQDEAKHKLRFEVEYDDHVLTEN
jgi:rubrerythrin